MHAGAFDALGRVDLPSRPCKHFRRLSRTLVAACSGLAGAVLGWLVPIGSIALAQTAVEPRVALVVRADSRAAARCFEVDALRQRIAYYGRDRLARANDLRLELAVDTSASAELLVYRGAALVSRRRFEKLPEACFDRRDAVALSIALALEGVLL